MPKPTDPQASKVGELPARIAADPATLAAARAAHGEGLGFHPAELAKRKRAHIMPEPVGTNGGFRDF